MRRTIAALLVGGCATTPTVVDQETEAYRRPSSEPIPEHLLLDIGVDVFAANIAPDFDAEDDPIGRPEVRRAEGNYLAYLLKEELNARGDWAAVRVTPHGVPSDVGVEAVIEDSDGEVLALRVRVTDARGALWFEKRYEALASAETYAELRRDGDPFEELYRQVASDMRDWLYRLPDSALARVRTISEMRFAQELAPDAFADYVVETDDGTLTLRRLPAVDDPLLARVRQIRSREHLFLDTLDEYFADFNTAMFLPYRHWRRATYQTKLTHRRLAQEARARTLAGSAALIDSITVALRDEEPEPQQERLAVGASLLIGAMYDDAAAQAYADVLRELGESAEAEIVPHTLRLENRTITLKGALDTQYATLRALLKDLWLENAGHPTAVE